MRYWTWTTVLLLALGPTTALAQSADDIAAARRLVGMWRLVDRTVTFADGTSRPDLALVVLRA